MSKQDVIEIEGTVTEALPKDVYKRQTSKKEEITFG